MTAEDWTQFQRNPPIQQTMMRVLSQSQTRTHNYINNQKLPSSQDYQLSFSKDKRSSSTKGCNLSLQIVQLLPMYIDIRAKDTQAIYKALLGRPVGLGTPSSQIFKSHVLQEILSFTSTDFKFTKLCQGKTTNIVRVLRHEQWKSLSHL